MHFPVTSAVRPNHCNRSPTCLNSWTTTPTCSMKSSQRESGVRLSLLSLLVGLRVAGYELRVEKHKGYALLKTVTQRRSTDYADFRRLHGLGKIKEQRTDPQINADSCHSGESRYPVNSTISGYRIGPAPYLIRGLG